MENNSEKAADAEAGAELEPEKAADAEAEADAELEPEKAAEAEVEADAEKAPEVDKKSMDWFVLHTYSGYEKKVAGQIRERLRQEGQVDCLGEILVPEEDVVEVRGGKKRISARKFFPGYILIEMLMDEKVWYTVKETPRITGFLGDASQPTPLSSVEVSRIKEQLTGSAEKPKPKYTFDVGEAVRVNEGPFANFTGTLDEVNMERAKVKVMISVFGRSTPVELEFSQIEKI